jgi:hypothetical protein
MFDYKGYLADTLSISEALANGGTLRLTDVFSISETPKFSVVLAKADSLSISETLAKSAGSVLGDTLSFAESPVINYGKSISDTVTFSEDLVRSGETLHISFSDYITLLDAGAVADLITPFLTDSQSLAESITKVAVVLGLTDNVAFAEAMTTNISLGKTDILGIAEAVVKAISISKSDTESVTEVEKWFFNKKITDSITLVDTSQQFDVTQEAWWGLVKYRTSCHGGL